MTSIQPVPSPHAPSADAAAPLPQFNWQGRVLGTVKRLPFTRTVELRFGNVVGQFDQLFDARRAALALSDGARPAVAIATFPKRMDDVVERERFVLYDVDYGVMSRPLNPMEHPRELERGDYHEGMVRSFGYESKDLSWDPGSAQYIVDDGRVSDIENLEERV